METVPVSAAEAPPVVSELTEFLSRMSTLGKEVGFWRARAQTAQLERFAEELAKLNSHWGHSQNEGARAAETLKAMQALHAQIAALARQVPFESRVNFIHRSLIPCYQQIYILENLVASILCRLRHNGATASEKSLPAGSMLSAESRRELRDRFREIVPSWDQKEWNLYDSL